MLPSSRLTSKPQNEKLRRVRRCLSSSLTNEWQEQILIVPQQEFFQSLVDVVR